MCLTKEGFICLSHCSLPESPSRSSVQRLYPEYLRILRVTSSLLIVLAYREGSNWITVSISFIQGLCSHLIQQKWRNVETTYKLLGFWYIPFILPAEIVSIFVQPPLLVRFYLALISDRHYLWSIRDAYHHLMWCIERFGYLGSENIRLTRPN